MTARFKRQSHGRGHSYLLDGHKVPGVTTVIGVLDKPALVDWAARVTAEYAVSNWDRLAGMSPVARYEELKQARWKVNKEATTSGKRIHSLGERVAAGESIATVPAELRPQVQAYADLLDAWEFEPIQLEAPCANTTYRYAGTFDAILTSPRLGTVIADIKTGTRVYAETALQLAAYRNADLFLEEIPQVGPRGGKRPSLWEERPMPPVDGAVVLHLRQETDESPASAEVVPVDVTEDVFEAFLYLLEIYETWIKRTNPAHRNEPIFAPPVGEAIYPEQDIRL